MNDDTISTIDDSDQERRGKAIGDFADSVEYQYDAIIVLATYRDEHGYTRTIGASRGNYYARIGLIHHAAKKYETSAAIEQTRSEDDDDQNGDGL